MSSNPTILNIPPLLDPNLLEDLLSSMESLFINPPSALILSSTHPKHFCLGLNFKVAIKLGPRCIVRMGETLMKICYLLLVLPCPVICVLNGNANAGGTLISLCADYRIMAEDSGKIWMGETSAGLVISFGLSLILRHKLRPHVVRDLIVSGKMFSGTEAFAEKIVDELGKKEIILERGFEVAREMIKSGQAKDRARWVYNAAVKCKEGGFEQEIINAVVSNWGKL